MCLLWSLSCQFAKVCFPLAVYPTPRYRVSLGLLGITVLRLPGVIMLGLLAVAEVLAIPAFWLLPTAVPGVLATAVFSLAAVPVIWLLDVPMAGLLVVAVLRFPSLAPLSLLGAAVELLASAVVELLATALSRLLPPAPLGLLNGAIGPPTSAVVELPAITLSRFPSAVEFWPLAVAVPGLLRGTDGSAFLHSRFLAKARSVALSPINGERPTQPGSPRPRLSWS